MNNHYFALFFLLSFCLQGSLSLKNSLKRAPPQKSLSFIQSNSLSSRLLVGFWHNFDNGIGILPLSQVSSDWDVINVSFGETGSDESTVLFTPCYGSVNAFKTEIQGLQAKGQKVLLSLGGQNGIIKVKTETQKQNFLNSIDALMSLYGFDGIDVDLEHGMGLDAGDSDFKNPTTSHHKNLISALNSMKAKYGVNFILSMAPELAYVQGGISAYAGVWGGYLPVIYGVRDSLTYIHVQHYNTGGATGLDGGYYAQGTADFEVAMAEALLQGFPIANNVNNMFPALREEQVLIGLPANGPAAPAGGYIKPAEMIKALDYLMKGVSFGGKYVMRNEKGYPGFRGLMTWSINWDKFNNFEFSKTYREYFGGGERTTIVSNTTIIPNTTTTVTPTTTTVTPTTTNTTVTYTPTTSTSTDTPTTKNGTGFGYPITHTPTINQNDGPIIVLNCSSTASTTTPAQNQTQATTPTQNETQTTTPSQTPNQTTTPAQTQTPAPTPTTTLQAAQVSASSSTSSTGSFSLTAKVPAGSKATGYTWFENNVEVSTCQETAAPIVLNVTGKASGTYNYRIVLTDGVNSACSSTVTVTVQIPTSTTVNSNSNPNLKCPLTTNTSPGFPTQNSTTSATNTIVNWSVGVAYKVGDKVSYNGLTYKCINPHTSISTWNPTVASLWSLA